MIIGGGSRAGPGDLATHLLRTDENEVARVIEIRGVAAKDLHGALDDMQAVAALTDGTKGLYHASIDPDTQGTMTPAQWARSVAVLEKELRVSTLSGLRNTVDLTSKRESPLACTNGRF